MELSHQLHHTLPYSGFISLLDRLVCYTTCLQKSINFYHVQILCFHANRKAFYWTFPSPFVVINLYCTVTLASLLHKSILLICVVMPWWAYFLSTLLLSTQGNLNSCFPRPLWTYSIPLAHELSLYKKSKLTLKTVSAIWNILFCTMLTNLTNIYSATYIKILWNHGKTWLLDYSISLTLHLSHLSFKCYIYI